ncbi:hypothetical protein EBU99_05095 [bacterium]|nr:hypothetical protein [bacterium]
MKRLLLIANLVAVFALAACGQMPSQGSDALMVESDGENFIVIGDSDTLLKKTTADSSSLALGSEKCTLKARTKIMLSSPPSYEGSHYSITTSEMLPDCSFKQGYVFRAHVAKSSLKSLFSANVRAFLDTIAYAEGTNDRYDLMFTRVPFYSYDGHPRAIQCSYGLCSDAAGRYQFLSTTWDQLRREAGLTDFSPESQDRAAIQLIKDVGYYSTVVNIGGYSDFERAAYGLSRQWASLPGSPYGQPTHSASQLWSKFSQFLARY